MRIAILGAGGLGGYLGAVLFEAGHEVVLVTRGEHFDVIAERGLEVSEGGQVRRVPVPCSLGSDLEGQFDAAFVTVKSYALETIAPLAARLAHRGALIVPLVNGVDACELLSNKAGDGVPPDRATAGVAYVTAFRTKPGTVERVGTHQRLVFGPHTTLPDGQSLLEAAFADTPVDIEVVSDVRPELWRKMAVVCALTAMCGGARAPIGAVRADPVGLCLQKRAVDEVLGVGRALGVPLADNVGPAVHAILDAFDDNFFPSLLHDVRLGRRSEVDALNGTISRLGRETGIATPVHDFASMAIRVGYEEAVLGNRF